MSKTIEDVYDYIVDKFDGITSLSSELINEFLDFILEMFDGSLEWLYNFFFVDLWGTCSDYGQRLFEFFFSTFCTKTFSFESVEYVVGFIFIVFALKFTVHLVRG